MKKSDNGKKPPVWLSDLHIDDGWMGGGTEVRHNDEILFGVGVGGYLRRDGNNDDFADFKGSPTWQSPYFDWAKRKNVFHYCLFGHYFQNHDAFGVADRIGGDDFFISDQVIMDCWWMFHSREIQQANTFVHELGHNLGLGEGDGGSESSMGPGPSDKVGYGTAWGDIDLTDFVGDSD